MTEDDDIDGLAAEYVLGSLDPSERVAVEVRRRSDRALADAIAAWERRLGPLSWRTPEVQPPAHLFEAILTKIAAPRSAEVVFLRRHAKRWRGIAAATTAIAACLGLAVGWFLYERIVEPALLVAELYRAAGTSTADEIMHPAFVVSVDLNACAITARPVTAQPRPGRNYQLWIMRQGVPAPEIPWRPEQPRTPDGALSGADCPGNPPQCHARREPGTRRRIDDGHTDGTLRLSGQADGGRSHGGR